MTNNVSATVEAKKTATATANANISNSALKHNSALAKEQLMLAHAKELQAIIEKSIKDLKITAFELQIQDTTTNTAVFKKNNAQAIQLDFSKTSTRVRDRIQLFCYSAHYEIWIGDNITIDTHNIEQYHAYNRFQTQEQFFTMRTFDELKNCVNVILQQFSTVTTTAQTSAKKTDSAKKTAKKDSTSAKSKTSAKSAKKSTKTA